MIITAFTAEIIQNYWWLMFALFALVVWIIDRQLAIPEIRYRCDGWFLRLPLIGELITKLDVARFSRTLGTLLTNGVPLLMAISIVKEVISNQDQYAIYRCPGFLFINVCNLE